MQQPAGDHERLGDRVVQIGGQLAAGALLGRHEAGQQLDDAGARGLRRDPMPFAKIVG
jgi:hypothetical protein